MVTPVKNGMILQHRLYEIEEFGHTFKVPIIESDRVEYHNLNNLCLDYAEKGWGRAAAFKRAVNRAMIEVLGLERVLDPFCAYGVSSVAYATAEPVRLLWANDKEEVAFEQAVKNIRKYVKGKEFVVTNQDARRLLEKAAEDGYKFDFIDIDPFSKAWAYTPAALKCCDNVISITENTRFYRDACRTNVETFNSVTMKRYGYKMPRLSNPFLRDNVYLRGLMGYVEKEARKIGKSVEPVLSLANSGVGKVYGRMVNYRRGNINDAWLCPECDTERGNVEYESALYFGKPCGEHGEGFYLGGIWSKELIDEKLMAKIAPLLEDVLFKDALQNLPYLRSNKILSR